MGPRKAMIGGRDQAVGLESRNLGRRRGEGVVDEAERGPIISPVTHLLSAYCIPCHVLGKEVPQGTRQKALLSWSSAFYWERDKQ